jgi:hypothetical protein
VRVDPPELHGRAVRECEVDPAFDEVVVDAVPDTALLPPRAADLLGDRRIEDEGVPGEPAARRERVCDPLEDP